MKRCLLAAPASRVAIVFSLAGFLCAALLGGLAALEDTLSAPTTLAAGIHADFSHGSNIFVRLRVFHPIAVALGVWLVIAALARWGLSRICRPPS